MVAFASAEQRRRTCRVLDVPTVKWAVGDLPEECLFFLNKQLMFLKREKEPTTKMFDDDERTRPLAEAEATTADFPEEQATCVAQGDISQDQREDPKKVRTIHMGDFCDKIRIQPTLGAQ